ncbi:MAG: hypothetical protein M3N51_10210 [Actinomycetota bacterium]|nr:hypothetical protein [Actinomycetota bacterium]
MRIVQIIAPWHNTGEVGRERVTQTCTNCGATVDGEQFCPECGQWVELDEDSFEPFSLEEGPPSEDPPPRLTEVEAPPEVVCPSCGAANPAFNRHCEECGARLSQAPLPVAPQPMIRASAGARALAVLVAVVLVVALLALLVNLFRPSPPRPVAAETSGSTTTAAQVAIQELQPVSVEASSEIPGFEASHLVDDDPTNSWNDASLGGRGAELTFRFGEPVQITSIVIQNLTEEERFLRNFRIRGYQIVLDDHDEVIPGELENTREPQQIEVPSLRTTVLTLKVTSTYPAEPVGENPPFQELALQEVKFFGRPNP